MYKSQPIAKCQAKWSQLCIFELKVGGHLQHIAQHSDEVISRHHEINPRRFSSSPLQSW